VLHGARLGGRPPDDGRIGVDDDGIDPLRAKSDGAELVAERLDGRGARLSFDALVFLEGVSERKEERPFEHPDVVGAEFTSNEGDETIQRVVRHARRR
jgi:hypothetical protein